MEKRYQGEIFPFRRQERELVEDAGEEGDRESPTDLELKFEKESQYQQEIHEKQRQTWEEKLDAELELAQKKLEMENNARATTAKLRSLGLLLSKERQPTGSCDQIRKHVRDASS